MHSAAVCVLSRVCAGRTTRREGATRQTNRVPPCARRTDPQRPKVETPAPHGCRRRGTRSALTLLATAARYARRAAALVGTSQPRFFRSLTRALHDQHQEQQLPHNNNKNTHTPSLSHARPLLLTDSELVALSWPHSSASDLLHERHHFSIGRLAVKTPRLPASQHRPRHHTRVCAALVDCLSYCSCAADDHLVRTRSFASLLRSLSRTRATRHGKTGAS